jgi:hypothetical protein
VGSLMLCQRSQVTSASSVQESPSERTTLPMSAQGDGKTPINDSRRISYVRLGYFFQFGRPILRHAGFGQRCPDHY